MENISIHLWNYQVSPNNGFFDGTSIKKTLELIKIKESKNDTENLGESKLSRAMRELIIALQNPQKITTQDNEWNQVQTLKLDLSTNTILAIALWYGNRGFKAKQKDFYEAVTKELNSLWIWFKECLESLIFVQWNNLVIIEQTWNIIWVYIEPNKDLKTIYQKTLKCLQNLKISPALIEFELYQSIRNQITNKQ